MTSTEHVALWNAINALPPATTTSVERQIAVARVEDALRAYRKSGGAAVDEMHTVLLRLIKFPTPYSACWREGCRCASCQFLELQEAARDAIAKVTAR